MRTVTQLARRLFCFLLVFSISAPLLMGVPQTVRAETSVSGDPCRIAITAPWSFSKIDLTEVGVASFLNWGVPRPSGIPDYIEHVKVIRVHDPKVGVVWDYTDYRDSMPGWLSQPEYQGKVWIIGNEPDSRYQDNITAEVYADRYYEMANIIRTNDPTARIGFAPIVQPSPLRIRYLDRVVTRLNTLTGSITATMALVDVVTIHAFILNEKLNEWGADIPPGFESNPADAYVIDIWTELYKTYDINTFSLWVANFRQWMKDHQAQGKPLWITEYGSLMPPIDPPSGLDYFNVSDEDTINYMRATFDFFYNTTDVNTGYPSDGNHLVQRGYWYSLNEYPYSYGGSLFDPRTNNRRVVGDAYVEYDPPGIPLVNPDATPVTISMAPLLYTPGTGKTRVDYRVDVRISNLVVGNNRTQVSVNLTGDGNFVGTAVGYLPRCGGSVVLSVRWNNVVPLVAHNLHADVSIQPGSGADIDLNNNDLDAVITPDVPLEVLIPVFFH